MADVGGDHGRRWKGLRARRVLRRRGLVRAAWLAFVGVLFLTGAQSLADAGVGVFSPVVAGLVVLPLLLVRQQPVAASWLVFTLGVAAPLTFPIFPAPGLRPWVPHVLIVALIVLYMIGLRYDRRALVKVAVLTSATVVWAASRVVDNPAGWILLLNAPIVAGYLVGARQRAQTQVAEGERRLEEIQTRRAVLEERARIARELHDVVAHHMSMIAVQAETAPFRIPDMPEASKECLAEISSTARGALVEMRRLLGVLRSEDAEAERAPQPGLDQIEGLVAAARRAGVTVDHVVTGAPRPLPAGTDLSAYRIVQEALSNAIRHAPGADVRVETRYEPDGLRILVANGAPAGAASAAPPGPWGHGLVGMRERVTMLGGALAAGATPDGGYLVDVSLPVDGEGAET